MEKIKISARHKSFTDINDIEPDYIEVILNELQNEIAFTVQTLAKADKEFYHEPLIAIKALIEYQEKSYSISLNRSTFEDIFLVNIEIETKYEETDLFSSLYDFKVAVIKYLKQKFGEVYYIHDSSNQKICTYLYSQVHDVENDFRQLITDFFIRKMGSYALTKELRDNASDYSHWYNKTYKNSPFRNTENILFNVMTDKLFDVLKRASFELESWEKKNLEENIEKLNEFLDDLTWTVEFTINSSKLNSFRKSFEDKFKEYQRKTIYDLYFKDSLTDDFEGKWKDFAKMRNMVAHNKPICKELYKDILDSCKYLKDKIKIAKEKVENMFIPDEVQMVDALYEEEMLKLQAEAEEIDYQREMSGLEPVWSEDMVIEILQNHSQIERLMTVINCYENAKRTMEEYSDTYYKLDDIVANLNLEKTECLKKKVEEVFDTVIEVDSGLSDEDYLNDIKAEIMSLINAHILNLDDVYESIDKSKYIDYFSIDEPLATFYDLANNEYSIYVCGSINPDHNYEEEIEIYFKKNGIIMQKGSITINYGGFDSYDYFENQAENPIEGEIELRLEDFNEEIFTVIMDIISDIGSRIERLEKIISFAEL